MGKSRRPLHALYDHFNVTFWEGRLPRAIPVMLFGGPVEERGMFVRRGGARDGQGLLSGDSYCVGLFRPAGKFTPPRILVLSPLGAEMERRVLLHEMAHAAVWIAGGCWEPQHGPRFRAELERLAGRGEGWATEEARRYAPSEAGAA
jgi:hypothetical protein